MVQVYSTPVKMGRKSTLQGEWKRMEDKAGSVSRLAHLIGVAPLTVRRYSAEGRMPKSKTIRRRINDLRRRWAMQPLFEL